MDWHKKNGSPASKNHFSNNQQYKNNNFNALSKENILRQTNNGLDILEKVFKVFNAELKIGTKIFNPFYKDSNPGLSINLINESYVFNDFGDKTYCGDVFDFYAHYCGIDSKCQFQDLLKQIAEDLKLDVSFKNESNIINPLVATKPFTSFDVIFWGNYGINKEILNYYNVQSVDWFKIPIKTVNRKIYSNNNLTFSYQIGSNCFKIYQPLSTKYKFSWVGKKPENYIFGYEQLDYTKDLIIIAAGEKDVLSFAYLGYNAVCFNSETEIPEPEMIQEFKNNFTYLFVCYDRDETGKKQSNLLQNKFAIACMDIEYLFCENQNGKDISDYTKQIHLKTDGFTIEKIQNLIEYSKSIYHAIQNNLPKPFPLQLFNQLPKLIGDVLKHYLNQSEKEMILLGMISLLSGLLPNCYFIYNNKEHEANLFLFVIGKPASGKGKLNDIYPLGDNIHKKLVNKNKNSKKIELSNIKAIYIPGNSSHASFLSLLAANNERGILFETEADVLNENIGNEWGDYSVTLRKAFHHEKISLSRKTEKEYFELDSPKLTVLLTGTGNQFKNYFQSPENGLFSRFILLNLFNNSELINVFDNQNYNNDIYAELKEWTERTYEYLLNNPDRIVFNFTESQEIEFTQKLHEKINYYYTIDEQGSLDSSIKRLGLIVTRVALILTVLDCKAIDQTRTLVCSDKTFNVITALFDSLFEHIKYSYFLLPKDVNKNLNNYMNQGEKLYNALSDSFTRQNAILIAGTLEIQKDYVDKILRMKSYFTKIGRGQYRKSQKSAVSTKPYNSSHINDLEDLA